MNTFRLSLLASTLIASQVYAVDPIDPTYTNDSQVDITSYEYTAPGIVYKTTYPDGRTQTAQSFSNSGQPTQIWENNGGTSRFFYFSYNPDGNITKVTPPNSAEDSNGTYGSITTYQYNGFGERIREIAPEVGTIKITRDSLGNPTKIIDGKNASTDITYDLLNRPTSKVVKNSSGTTVDTFTYSYDTTKGYPTSVTNNTGTLAWTWATTGELLSQTQTVDSTAISTSWTYDTVGRPTQQVLPSGNQINYAYNSTTGLLSSVQVKNPQESFSRTLLDTPRYGPFGDLRGWTWGNGRPHLENLDKSGKILQVMDRHAEQLQYNGVAQITSRSDLNPTSQFIPIGSGDQFSYTYDAFNRLSQQSLTRNSTTTTLNNTWAVNDNRQDANTTFYAQSASIPNYTTQQWLTKNSQTATYDAAGNIVQLGTRGYGYNALNQLTSVSDSSTLKGTYSYGPNGFRTKKVTPSKTLHFVYLPDGSLLGEYEPISGGYHVDREHIYLRGAPVGVLSDGWQSYVSASHPVSPMDLNYVHTDALGTPRKITQADTGNLVWTWLQDDPWGNNAPDTTNGIVYNLRYAGQYKDEETGLIENRNRFYDPLSGRYLNPDPIGLDGGMHRYNYVSGDPVNSIDPMGLAETGARIGGAIGGFFGTWGGGVLGGLGGGAGGTVVLPGVGTTAGIISGAEAGAAAGGIAGIGIGSAIGSKIEDACQSNNDDPCKDIQNRIRDIAGKLKSKMRQLQNDPYDLYNKAYSVNPGGNIAGKGTYLGHMEQINGLKKGLAEKIAEALAKGCPIPNDILQLLN